MPERPLRPCKYNRCTALTRNKSGYCDAHIKESIQPDNRVSSFERGYNARWKKFRIAYLKQHPLCVDCLKQGIYTPSREPHHIQKLRDRPELKYEESNLIALCHDCHSKRTARGE